jgi:hypothetical protein
MRTTVIWLALAAVPLLLLLAGCGGGSRKY